VVVAQAACRAVASVFDLHLYLIWPHGLAAQGARRPAPGAARCATPFRRWQLSAMDGFSGLRFEDQIIRHQWADLVAPSCAPKKGNELFVGGGWRRGQSGSSAAPSINILIQMDIESVGVPFASRACRRGGAPKDVRTEAKMPGRQNSAEQMAPLRPPPRATEPAWNGYLLTVSCPCGVVFERWVTPEEADVDLLRFASLN
jgi:hypothetical protein